MKLITAFIRPGMASKVTDALRSAGIDGMTILPYSGHGHLIAAMGSRHEEKADTRGDHDKTKLEIVCPDADKAAITAVIREHARTGHPGDGKVFVSTVDETQDILTGTTRDVIDPSLLLCYFFFKTAIVKE